MVCVRPSRRLRAESSGRYPSAFSASSTRVLSSGLTNRVSLRTWETVATEVPAALATSRIVAIVSLIDYAIDYEASLAAAPARSSGSGHLGRRHELTPRRGRAPERRLGAGAQGQRAAPVVRQRIGGMLTSASSSSGWGS